MYTIYTYWNADGVIAVLNALVLIMGGGDYLGLARTLAISGMLIAAGVGLAKISAKEPMQYFVFLGLFYFGLFVPKVSVDVIDVRTGAVGTVGNVPFGVAFVSSFTSHIGKYLTDAFETNFQPVATLRFANTGMGFGARAFQEVPNVRMLNPKLSDSMLSFTRACVNPEIVNSPNAYTALINSDDVWTMIGGAGWLNPGRSVSMPDPGGAGYVFVSCPVAYGLINGALPAEINSVLGALAQKLNPEKGATTATWAAANAAIAGQLADVEGYMLNTARNAQDQIKQGMMANALSDAGGSLAAARNDPAAMQSALAAKMAEMQSNNSYKTLGLIGEAALPKFRNIVEIVLISVFPIVMLLIIMGGEKGGLILKTYLMTSVWVQLWAPLYAIVNFMMLEGTANRLQSGLFGAASQTILNTSALTATAFKESSLAGALVFAVPVIAFALIKGGEVAMNGAMSSLTATASGAASTQGGSVGVGNVAAGNVSWGNTSSGNMSANKWDTNGSISQGAFTGSRGGFKMSGDSGGAWTGGMGDGSHAVSGAGRNSDLAGLSAAIGMQFGSTVQSQYQSSLTKGNESTAAMVSSIQSGFSLATGHRQTSGSSSEVAASWSNGSQTGNGASFDKAFTDQLQWGRGAGLSQGETMALTAAGGLGTRGFSSALEKLAKEPGASKAVKALAEASKAASLSGDMSYGSNSALKSTFDSARKAGDSEAFKGGLQSMMTHASGTSTSNSSKAGSESDKSKRASYDEVAAAQNSARQSYGQAASYAELQSNMASAGGQMSVNVANAYVAAKGVAAAEKITRGGGGTPAQAAELQDFLKSQAAVMAGVTKPGPVDPAGGAAGTQLRTDAKSATASGAPPNLSQQQADLVQGHQSDAQAAVGKGPALTPGPVKGPDGKPVTAAGVQAQSQQGQADDRKALGTAGERVQKNVADTADQATGEIRHAGQPGAQGAQVVKQGASSLYDIVTKGGPGEAINKGIEFFGGSGIKKGAAPSRSDLAKAPPPDYKADRRAERNNDQER
jgi:conjugal transfer mating pair stabilization protein TraG